MNDSVDCTNDSGTSTGEDAQGAGAQGQHERRRRERRERVLARHPRIGWLLLALAGAQAYDERPSGGADGRARERGWDGVPETPSDGATNESS